MTWDLARVLGFVLVFVLLVRVRPWRWLSPWFRRV